MFDFLSASMSPVLFSFVIFIVGFPMYFRQLASDWFIKEDDVRRLILNNLLARMALSALGALVAVFGYWILSLFVDGIYSNASLLLSVVMAVALLATKVLTEKMFYVVCSVFSVLYCIVIVAIDGSFLSYVFVAVTAAALFAMWQKSKNA